jgi:hypothetical protein
MGEHVQSHMHTFRVGPMMDWKENLFDSAGWPDRMTVTPQNVGDKVHLRVELQGLWRMPRSNAILFSIRCCLIKMRELTASTHREVRRCPKPRIPGSGSYSGSSRSRLSPPHFSPKRSAMTSRYSTLDKRTAMMK